MERHLAAILSADVVGYSTLMHSNEVATLETLKSIRHELINPKVHQYRGRIIKLMGDGALIEFPSIFDAITCAIEVQILMAKRNENAFEEQKIQFRVGVNIGDVIVEGDDIYGDGVNLAARIERLAEPGGIFLSRSARNQVVHHLDLEFDDRGTFKVKGFEEPVHVFSVVLDDKAQALVTPVAALPSHSGSSARADTKSVSRRRHSWFQMGHGLSTGVLAVVFLFLGVGTIQFAASDYHLRKTNVLCFWSGFANFDPASVKIGAVMPLSKDTGKRLSWGIKRSFRDARPKLTFSPVLVLEDSQGSKEHLDLALAKFAVEGVAAVLGPMESETAYFGKKWGNKNRIPVVTSNASASYLTQDGRPDYFFRVSMSDGARVEALVKWIERQQFPREPYIIHEWTPPVPNLDKPESYGAAQATAAKREFSNATVIRFTRYDMPSKIEAAKQVSNDEGRAIMIFGYTDDILTIVRQLHLQGVRNRIYLTGVSNEKILNADLPNADKIRIVTGLISEKENPTNAPRLKQDFKDDNPNETYDVSAYYAYDSASMVLDAVQKTIDESCLGAVSGRVVARHLRATDDDPERKIVNGGFLSNRQEVFVRISSLKIVDGKFVDGKIGEKEPGQL